MNTDIDEFNLLDKPVKVEILEEHKQRLLKKREEMDDIKSLIDNHIRIVNEKLKST